MKLKVAFVDHVFHKKTNSTRFFIDLIRSDFDVTVLWYKGGTFNPIIKKLVEKKIDVIIFFQYIPNLFSLSKLFSKVIFIPMFDYSSVWQTTFFWLGLKRMNISIISFSKAISELTSKYKIRTLELQYFPVPERTFPKDFSKLKLFFWDRGGWNEKYLFNLIRRNAFSSIYYKGQRRSFFRNYKGYIVNLKDSDNKATYKKYLNRANIFLVSRDFEGIGMTFLEALSMGMIVVCKNNPTMNEYIINGVNGIITDGKKIMIPDSKKLNQISINATKFFKSGRAKWLNDSKKIEKFVKGTKNTKTNQKIFLLTSSVLDRGISVCNFLLRKLVSFFSNFFQTKQ